MMPRDTSWEDVADWYDGWVGKQGSKHHRNLAIPVVMEMLQPQQGESVLDIGCGQGVLAPYMHKAGAHYVGVDAASSLIKKAKRYHKGARFFTGDARHLAELPVEPASFDVAVFMLSIQDMDPLPQVIESAAWALKAGGRLGILMTHPCFRIPRQSGWGFDEGRKLQYRRVDSYLSQHDVPLTGKGRGRGGQNNVTRSYHRPLMDYVNALGAAGLAIDAMEEVPTYKADSRQPKAERRANEEIPLFLGLRALKIHGAS
ncbi:MAG: class I SAM-dependent methyltransferase [Anaerolineae bacterium]